MSQQQQLPHCFVLIPQDKAYVNLWDAAIRPAIEKCGMAPLRGDDMEKGILPIEMEPRDREKYPERVNTWLMRRREDPDNPVLSRAISGYLLEKGDLDAAKEEA